MFRIYDHRERSPVSPETPSFDEVITIARELAAHEPDRLLEVQRLEAGSWVPTGWMFGSEGEWE